MHQGSPESGEDGMHCADTPSLTVHAAAANPPVHRISVGKPSVKSRDSVAFVREGENSRGGSGGGVRRMPSTPGVKGDSVRCGGGGQASRGPAAALAAVATRLWRAGGAARDSAEHLHGWRGNFMRVTSACGMHGMKAEAACSAGDSLGVLRMCAFMELQTADVLG